MPCNQIFPNDYDSYAGRTYILLSSRVNDSISGKIDRSRTQIGWHIADDSLMFWDEMVREVVEFESLDCLVVAEVEELGILSNIPIFVGCDWSKFILLITCDFVSFAEFFRLIDRTLWPESSRYVVGTLPIPVLQQVIANGWVLIRSTTLEEEDFEVFRDRKKCLEIGSGFFRYPCESFWAVAHLHHAQTGTTVAH